MHGNDPEASHLPSLFEENVLNLNHQVLDREKRRSLNKQPYQTSSPMDHAPGWNETLATSSEAHVKADKATSVTTEDLVAQTVKHVNAKHSSDERMDSENAMYDRDEVEGPLRTATKETHTVVEEKVEKVT
ncbi:hypothetical protein OF83DRAFT_1069318 [Amylostereum chailletii]|nr:hypothetical protein OF83DRAFT_1069318 [Amylostereum chailletii]